MIGHKCNMVTISGDDTYCMSFMFTGMTGMTARNCLFFEESDPKAYGELLPDRCVWTCGNHRDFCLCQAAVDNRKSEMLSQAMEEL